MRRYLAWIGTLALVACHGQVLTLGSGPNGGNGSNLGPGGGEDSGLPVVTTQPVTKVDLLFMIDNSASMGDKQLYLEKAIPDLISRLVTPNCVAKTDATTVLGASSLGADGTATCAAFPDASLEFPGVHDMHIGVVSSSLGPRLGDLAGDGKGGECAASDSITLGGVTIDRHNDDQGHLLTRSSTPADTSTESALADASSGFLAWFPNAAANSGKSSGSATPVASAGTLVTDFTDLVIGVHSYGCGVESQLESWYRFLIQPDPYASLALGAAPANEVPPAVWVGVDTTILKQRHDFLRPDSLVAIVDLTDENDSEIDVRSIGGQGYLWMSNSFHPPHGTDVCATNPGDPGCASQGGADPAPYSASNDWGYDLNLRHVHMKEKYGLDPQFPISRYVTGLSSGKVPDRTGEYPSGAESYVGTNNCTNPLFAASLPDGTGLSASIATTVSASDAAALCNLPVTTTRPASLVFFTLIGGVPWQLLHFDPTSATNSALTNADWSRIQGNNPDAYDYNGIDPHMIESTVPRGSTAFAVAAPLPAVNGAQGTSPAETTPAVATGGNTDPYNGREWNTSAGAHVDLSVDRQYACIFKLVDPGTGASSPRDCSNSNGVYTDPANGPSCDCSSTVGTGGITADELSPVCDPASPNSQLYAKAYPTARELNLASKLGLQGVVASICPIDVADNASGTDPLFGYRPAVTSLISHMKSALVVQ